MSRATQSIDNTPAPARHREPPQVALTIAGFDPTSGAGISADLKVFAAHGIYGVAAATALTVQSTVGVQRVEPVSASLLTETLICLAKDLPPAGIKIGMLATASNVHAVATFLENLRIRSIPIVLDPVLCSTSGRALLSAAGNAALRTRLLPLVTCITPNLDELLLLAALPKPAHADPQQSVVKAAATLANQHPHLAIIATGGHLPSPNDYVLTPNAPNTPPALPTWLPGVWIDTPATHGTGCAYSSALLCALIAGRPLLQAATTAKHYVTEALRAATPIGQGGGSMHHLYASHRQSPRGPNSINKRKRP